MKKITLVFTGEQVPAALIEFGKAIGAQFRNGNINEGEKEHCDYVCGDPIPESYQDVEIHPQWENFLEGNDIVLSSAPDEEVEVTAEYIDKLTKKQLLKLVEDEDLDFTAEQKKNVENLQKALKEHFEV